jgi:leucyl-tRNA synthetase
MVLAPEHALVEKITTPAHRDAVRRYQQEAARKSDLERTELAKKKTGVWTGAHAINPVNGEQVPVWIADYVLASYGTGAIMAVPAHDERDFEFAKQFGLPIPTVVRPPQEWLKKTGSTLEQLAAPYVDDGVAMNSGQFDGLPTAEFKQKIIAWLEQRGLGVRKVNYKLRDWLFSRQRYWGEPFPILHELDEHGQPTGVIEALGVEELPLRLPELSDYHPSGKAEPPLEKAKDWLYVTRNGKRYKRETNTMPQWAGSCWYYIRFIDPRNDRVFCDKEMAKRWLPVDLYVGGAEHAVLHLLYSRFWHKVLYDRGHLFTPEPFRKLVNQGMIVVEEYHLTPEAYAAGKDRIAELGLQVKHWKEKEKDKEEEKDIYVLRNPPPADKPTAFCPLNDKQVVKAKGKTLLEGTDIELIVKADKMSKARGNVINPDEVVEEYGADSLRLYEMFMGPLEASKPWNMRSVNGVYGFLGRVWRLYIDDRAEQVRLNDSVREVEPDRDTLRQLHRTIGRVTDDLDGMRFNTAIAAMMELTNHLTPLSVRPRSVLEPFVLLLAPFAPHLAEELWRALGHEQTLAYEPWPAHDPALLEVEEVEVPVQVNGKLRLRLMVPAGLDAKGLQDNVLARDEVRALMEGKTVRRVIVPPRGGLVNIVVG